MAVALRTGTEDAAMIFSRRHAWEKDRRRARTLVMRVPMPSEIEAARPVLIAGVRAHGLERVPRPLRLPEGSLAKIELPRAERRRLSLHRRLPSIAIAAAALAGAVSVAALLLAR
jgi:hypothetical protein